MLTAEAHSAMPPHRALRAGWNPFIEEFVILQEDSAVDLATPGGPMRTYVYRPVAPGRYPGLVFFSEIFQRTAPIRRTAALLAGHGFVVAVPEIFHELEPPGAELPYDQAGADRGNQ